jgi:hypothetical protein
MTIEKDKILATTMRELVGLSGFFFFGLADSVDIISVVRI